ncbi:uncharacterized protein rab11fip1b isoform X2 [Paramisgurnus dabryanus]|uniref:uncharacterized protein rab11fip1b isoform X2 n=1 Tax=Paramisgurnus dabryanus TaxID=90735 RepID=UPI0031F406BA
MSLSEQSQQWYPTSVQVTVLQARGLRIKGKNGTNDAYAIMQVAKEKFSTSVSEKSVAPVWKEEAAFDLPLFHPGNVDRCTLQVSVMHRALIGADKVLGLAIVNLLDLYDNKSRNKTEWFKLMGKTGKPDKDRGEVLLDIQFMKNNMTASMFDLSGIDKSRSRLGKIKDKLKGKKKDGMSDSASAIVPSVGQIVTDSEGEEEADATPGIKKKSKLKSLFAPKVLQRNMSQSMSTLPTLPEKDSAISLSRSSGLNVDSSEGKKKFKLFKHKRNGSSDSKVSQGAGSLGQGLTQSNLCVNGSHVYAEETRESRAGSTFSLNSSGHGSMEDLRRGHDRKISTTSVETEPEDNAMEEMQRRQEEQMKREQEAKKRLEEEKRRRIEEEEREQFRREEMRKEEERKRFEREEERKWIEREEERKRVEREEEKRRLEKMEEERKRIEREEAKKRIEREEERKLIEREEEEKERRLEKMEEEKKRIEREKERKRIEREEEKRRLEKLEEERKRIEREEERKRIEREEERKRIEREEEEEERLEKLEEERKRIEREEERKRIEREEERKRIEREEQRRIEEEEEMAKIKREQEKVRREEEEKRIKEERRRKMEEEGRTKLETESMKKDEDTKRIEAERRHAEEEERLRKEKMEAEENRKRKEEEERRMTEEKELKERERVRLEKEKMELEKTEKALKERMRREEERKLKAEQERIRQEKDEMEKQKKEKEQMNAIERRPDVKPRSARMNTGTKTEKADTIPSQFANPLEESLLLDEISTSPFEQSKASAKVSAVRPRAHAVKPLSTIDNQPDFKDNFASAKIAEGAQVSMKAPDAKGTGSYSQLTHEELVNLLERQKDQLSQKDTKIMELEQYIDNLLVRVIEENPSILMSLSLMKKSV